MPFSSCAETMWIPKEHLSILYDDFVVPHYEIRVTYAHSRLAEKTFYMCLSQTSCLQLLSEDSTLTCGLSCIIYRQRDILSLIVFIAPWLHKS